MNRNVLQSQGHHDQNFNLQNQEVLTAHFGFTAFLAWLSTFWPLLFYTWVVLVQTSYLF